MRPTLSRRQFLERVGAAGGSAAVYRAAGALGLLPTMARAGPLELAQAGPRGATVAILGAGIGGLTAAYELSRAGYQCVVLEASKRAGGRNFTARAGDVIDEIDQPQTCGFDSNPDLYFNCGPARIPADHTRLLHYCRTFGVRLELFVNENRNAWVQDDAAFGGKPVRNRQYVADTRGFLAELVAKSLQRSAFDAPLHGADAERLLELARAFGDLDVDDVYRGTFRAGYESGGLVTPGIKHGVFDLGELLKADFWRSSMQFGEGDFQIAPMMQPVGGMDGIVAGFMREVGSLVKLEAQVRSLTLRESGVEIVYEQNGQTQTLAADYCLDNIPMHLLGRIEHNFPADYAVALAAVPAGRLFKIGLQARRRFWEDENIYGGISWTSQAIKQVWYPSHGIHSAKGVLLGAYTFGEAKDLRFEELTPQQRLELAIAQGEKLHPGFGKHIENGISIPWYRIRHLEGCAAEWTDELVAQHFKTLQAPAGRHWLIGDQVSFHPGWQEGAIASALHAVEDLGRRAANERGGAVRLA